MHLRSFTAKNVHGYLDFEIPFNERLNFLIGINGTGKTSVLKLILGLITPSYQYLNAIEFESATLVCTDNSVDTIEISATRVHENEIIITLKDGNDLQHEAVLVRNSDYVDFSDEIPEKMRIILNEFEQQPTIKQIKSLTTPIFLGLDRRLLEWQQTDRFRQTYFYRRKYRSYPQNDLLNVSLMDIQEIIFDYVRLIASQQPKINEDFKNKILLQSFEFLDNQQINIIKDFKELKDKRKKALDAFENLKIHSFSEHVNNFFDQLEDVLRKLGEGSKKNNGSNKTKVEIGLGDISNISINPQNIEYLQKWFSNQPQLKRINELIDYNQAYQNEIQKLYQPIEKTKNIINNFFKESKKELLIDAQGEFAVKFKNDKIAKIYELSSGEKHIVTMLGHLIFFEENFKKEPGIFIIDEPEVSLHLAWQEIFVPSILDASPRTQFILATHSPAIVGGYPDEYCIDLGKLN